MLETKIFLDGGTPSLGSRRDISPRGHYKGDSSEFPGGAFSGAAKPRPASAGRVPTGKERSKTRTFTGTDSCSDVASM